MQEISDNDFFLKQLKLEDVPLHVTKSVSSMTARNHVQHVWQLERYSTLTEDSYESACFSAPGSDIQWALSFRPRFEVKSVDYIQVFLLRKSDLRDVRIFCRAQLLDVDGNICQNQQGMGVAHNAFGSKYFYPRSGISVEKKTLSPEGTLTLACDVYEISEYTANPSHLSLRYPSTKKKEHELLQELLARLKGNSDDVVTLVGKNDVRIEANQFILGARSAVLRVMFDTPMEEQRTRVVELEDIDGDVLREMVNFINTDNIGNLDKFAEPLLVVADRFEVIKLKMLCEEHLMKLIGPATLSHLQSLAVMTNATMLKESCEVFFKGH